MGVPLLTSIRYQRASSSFAATDTVWVATIVLFRSAALRIRESMLNVSALPSGCKGGSALAYGCTGREVEVKIGEEVRIPVILVTMMEVFVSLSRISHMGSPAAESCMTVGRRERAPMISNCLMRGEATPLARSLIPTALTWTRTSAVVVENMLSVNTNASRL